MRLWLLSVWAMILAMVLVGGITRLTESGLSMVEWRPLMGALPPLSEGEWQRVFERYQQTPQYQQVNHWMALADFKRIFFWEYTHRLFGRLIGLWVMLPFGYFLLRRQLSAALSRRVLIAILLGGAQGLLGWYMVQSGLVSEPRVSHFRLAAHLLLAFAVGQWVLWVLLDTVAPRDPSARARPLSLALTLCFIGLIVLQSGYGAFMAGTRAGYYYGSFPDMAGHYGPGPFFNGASWLRDAFHAPSAIHYIHRALAWLSLVYGMFLGVFIARAEPRPAVRRAGLLIVALVFLQFNLGALTVVSRVALPWAVAHQGMAYLLLSSAVLLLHATLGARWAGGAAERAHA